MRKHEEIQAKIESLHGQLNDIEADCKLDIDLIEEVLSFTRNIYKTYLDAPQFLKRHYMRFFYERFEVKDKVIVKAVPTPIFLVLQQNEAVILRNALLPLQDSLRNGYKGKLLNHSLEEVQHFTNQFAHLLASSRLGSNVV